MIQVLQSPYCTVEDVQRETQNRNADDVQLFIGSINSASRWIDGYCRRDFLYHDNATTALIVDERWAVFNKIYLPWPVLTLTKVESSDAFGNLTAMTTTDYRVNPQGLVNAVVEGNVCWFAPDQFSTPGLLPRKNFSMRPQVKLTGTFGYRLPVAADWGSPTGFTATGWPSPSIPSEISVACAVIAAVRSGKAKKDIIDFSGQKQSATVKVMPKEVMETLSRYRRPLL